MLDNFLTDEIRFEATQMRFYRMLIIPWAAQKSKCKLKNLLQPKETTESSGDHDKKEGLAILALTGLIEGKRGRGKH